MDQLSHKLSCLMPSQDWKNPKRHISALVKGGKVIACGESTLGGKPYFASSRGRSCHSEMSAIKFIGTNVTKRKVSKYTMWNIRWSKNGEIVNAKPCQQCQKVLLNIGIRRIVYSTSGGNLIKTKLDNLDCYTSSGFRY